MRLGARVRPASAHPCLLSFSLQRGPDLSRVSGNPVNSHTKTLFPALECPYFSRSPQPPARPGSGAVLSPSGQPSWGRGAQEAGQGSRGSRRSTGLSQHKCLVALGAPSQDLSVQTFGGPCHLTRGLAELGCPLRRWNKKPRRWTRALLSQMSLCGKAELKARPPGSCGTRSAVTSVSEVIQNIGTHLPCSGSWGNQGDEVRSLFHGASE